MKTINIHENTRKAFDKMKRELSFKADYQMSDDDLVGFLMNEVKRKKQAGRDK